MAASAIDLLVTCEHGGNDVPPDVAGSFEGQAELLASHRGWDPGALGLAQELARAFDVPCYSATVSRLVIDLNRSLHHPRVFSTLTAPLPKAIKQDLIARIYTPHRHALEQAIAHAHAEGRFVLHVAVHSFTPVLDGIVRQGDLGLLYDPSFGREAELARVWQRLLVERLGPAHRTRLNYPYLGKSDGLTKHLRRRFGPTAYAGIELELNQGLLPPGAVDFPAAIRDGVRATLGELIATMAQKRP